MNKQERVSSIQMSMLFLFFMTGSSIVIVPASLTNFAGNGAWISLIIASAIGMLLLTGILYLIDERRSYHLWNKAALCLETD
nr:GerAB/ArcD/ProY family transporter [Paenibacillus sp. VTT E-133291]